MSTEFINDQWRLPNAWNGTESNVNKQSNYSMDFDGSSLIDLGDITMLNGVSQASYSFWFKLTSNTPASGSASVMLIGSNAKGASCYYYGSNSFYIHNLNTKYILTTQPSLNNWHHVCCVFNSGVAEAYVDGISVGTVTEPTLTTTASDFGNNFNIGYSSFYSAYMNANGKIDGLSFFNYALSSSQVTTLYGSSSTGIGNPMSLSPKPVAYYPLGDQDAFNGSNYLVPNSSLKDYVFDFDGSDRINCGTSSLGITNAITVSAWVKIPSTTPNSVQPIVCERDNTIGNNWSLRYRGGSYNKYYFIAWNTNGNTVSAPSASITPNVDEWQHVVGVYDGSSTGRSYVYVNGVPRGTSQPPTGSGINSNSSVAPSIGGFQDLSAFVGSISNAQVFNTALPATGSNSVETLYNNGSPLTSMSGFSSLVSWWKLDASDTYDSSTGNWTIEDHAGTNDGTSFGMTQSALQQSDLSFTSGYSPYALDFDGADDYIDCGTPSTFAFGTGDFTISAWVYLDLSTNYQWLFSTGTNFAFGFDSSRNLQLWVAGTATTPSFNINLNQWHHIVATRNSGTVTFYIDGSAFGTTYSRTGSIAAGSYNYIGTFNVNQNHLNGKLSNISFWNAGLTSTQVTEIYNEGVPQNLLNHSAVSSLVSWWQLGSNSSFNTNWTVLDEKGSNNGTSVNMTEDAIVDGVGSYANGVSSGMSDNIVGDAFGSSANSLSYNMDVLDRSTDVPN